MVHLHTEGPGPHLAPEMAGHFRHRALFVGPERARGRQRGPGRVHPGLPVRRAAAFERGLLPLDAVLVNVTPPDAPRLLLARDVGRGDARRRSGRPGRSSPSSTARCRGRSARASSTSTRSTSASRSTCRPTSTPTARSATSSGGSASTSPSWSPTARRSRWASARSRAPSPLRSGDKHDLGIHTEMFTDVGRRPGRAGVVTGARKESNRGKIVAAFVMGTQRLYDFVDDNPMVEMRSVDYTNDTAVIRPLPADDRDQLGDRGRPHRPGRAPTRSAPGSTAASAARWTSSAARRWPTDGRAIIALPSTAAGGTVSRIVPDPAQGAGVVTTRAHVRTIVTEWGVAELFGRSLRERAPAP